MGTRNRLGVTMRSFKHYLQERKNPIPVGRFDNDVKMNTEHFIMKIERRNLKPKVIEIDPDLQVSIGVLYATQHEIDNRDGSDDPVLPEYEDKPILVNYDGDKIYIIDGHHRMAKAYQQKRKIKVYLFDLD